MKHQVLDSKDTIYCQTTINSCVAIHTLYTMNDCFRIQYYSIPSNLFVWYLNLECINYHVHLYT